ncbi:hypothetical protein PN498_08070 [Oscillatoria sp. CS-180]|uniref:hypothetical protein n=1 Tax=Oscillatoria sp. CS-180 TaxID=3021720 RepID=UPI00232AC259|nr:hypothetical protein [Oscillatoria sp. CS-180]MDB9525938.1 hypothetical protein [Oscillatoria sp. CS-180]
MSLSRWVHGAAVSGVLTMSASGAIAQMPPERTLEPPAEQTSPTEQTESQPDAGEPETFKTYTLNDTFSITVPQDWLVDGDEAENYALITSYSPESETPQQDDIRTEVSLVAESPDTYVGREIDALIQGGYVIDSYGVASVGGNKAFRVWIIDLPGDFTHQVITFIGYENGNTARLISYFNDDSPTTTDMIVNLHQSFELNLEEE